MRLFLYLLLCCFAMGGGCKAVTTKESSKKKTDLTFPAGSVFAFEKASITIPAGMPVSIVETANKVSPPDPLQVAKAEAIEKMYWVGFGLFVLSAILFYRAHVKAGFIALAGAIATPSIAKFYSSDAAQYVALASLCVAGALFFAWHLVKKKLPQEVLSVHP